MSYGRLNAPMGAYLGLVLLFVALLAGAFALAASRGGLTREALTWPDLLLLGIAASKASWLITKDVITSVLRAPFTEFKGAYAPDEVRETPRGSGLRLALGELLTCPFCTALWVAAAFIAGHLLAPAATRAVAAIFVVLTVADMLLVLYPGLRIRLLQPAAGRQQEQDGGGERSSR